MRRSVIIVGAVVGAALLARRLATRGGGVNWEAMLERMPDTAPPKWMFSNIRAIRENTEHILERLESKLVTEAA